MPFGGGALVCLALLLCQDFDSRFPEVLDVPRLRICLFGEDHPGVPEVDRAPEPMVVDGLHQRLLLDCLLEFGRGPEGPLDGLVSLLVLRRRPLLAELLGIGVHPVRDAS